MGLDNLSGLTDTELLQIVFTLRWLLIDLSKDDPSYSDTFQRLDRAVNEAVKRGLMVRNDKKSD